MLTSSSSLKEFVSEMETVHSSEVSAAGYNTTFYPKDARGQVHRKPLTSQKKWHIFIEEESDMKEHNKDTQKSALIKTELRKVLKLKGTK